MASPEQIAANRANARKSTGPRSAAGKAVASRNACKHRILAREALAAFEDLEAFTDLGQRMRAALAPDGPVEESLCERIVGCAWRLQRVVRLESELIAGTGRSLGERGPLESGWLRHVEADRLRLFSQYEARLDRMLHRSLHELQRAQAARRGAAVPPPAVVDVDVSGLSDAPETAPAARDADPGRGPRLRPVIVDACPARAGST